MSDEVYIPREGEKRIVVDETLCTHDHDCVPVKVCPVEAIRRTGDCPPVVNHRICLVCGACLKVCPTKALSVQRG